MKLTFHLALIAALISGVPASAAEITAEECAAIRNLSTNLAVANLEANKAMLEAHHAIMALMVTNIENSNSESQSKMLDGLKNLTKTLKAKDLDNKILVKGLKALNRVCPA